MAGVGGKWETVVAKKGRVTKSDVKKAQQKFIDGENVPKQETRDPLKLDKTQYATAFDNGNVDHSEEDEKYPSRVPMGQNESATRSPKVPNKKKEKKVPKAPPVFDLDGKIHKLNSSDFETIITDIKEKFPGHPLIWLKEVATSLQVQLSGPGEKGDLAYFNKKENYPLCEVPKDLRTTLEELIRLCESKTLNSFFIYLNTSLATEVQQGHCTASIRILLQVLCNVQPKITANNCDEVVAGKSRHGDNYLATLWALSLNADSLEDGMKVWWSAMFSVMDKKHHSAVAVKFVKKLFKNCSVNKIVAPVLTTDQMLQLIETMVGEKSPLQHTPSLMEEMQILFPKFLRLLLLDGFGTQCESVFKNILPYMRSQEDPAVLKLVCDVLVMCLSLDQNCMIWWVDNFIHFMRESSVLLRNMRDDPEVWKKLSSSKQYRPSSLLVKYMESIVENLDKANERGRFEKKAGFKDCRKLCSGIVRTEHQRKKEPSLLWKIMKYIIVTLLMVATVDVYNSGSYEASRMGKYLKSSGIEERAMIGFKHIQEVTDTASGYLREHVPYYYSKVSVYTDPALEVTWKYMQVAGVWIKKNSKPLRDYLNEVLPPLLEKVNFFLGEQYRIITTWLISLYTTYAPIVVQSAHGLYTWISVVIPQVYYYIANLIRIILSKIYELSPEFFDHLTARVNDLWKYVCTRTPVVMNDVQEGAAKYFNVAVSAMSDGVERSQTWIKDML